MPIIWQDVKSWLKETTKLAIKEAEDLTYKGKIKMQIYTLSHEKEHLIFNLGSLFYTEFRKNPEFKYGEKILEIVSKIHKTEEKIKEKKEELKKEQ